MLIAIVLVLVMTIGCVLAREGQGVPGPDGLRGRIQARGRGLLLLPVAMAAAVMAGGTHGLIPAELGIAALAIVFAPKLAARLVPFGVLGLAVFGVHLARTYRDGNTSRVQYLFRPGGARGLGLLAGAGRGRRPVRGRPVAAAAAGRAGRGAGQGAGRPVA